MPVTAVIGCQWGDEGKGKIVDYFAKNHDYVSRFQGGPNAGHTLIKDGKKLILHNYPSGARHNKRCLIGTGCQVDPRGLIDEMGILLDEGYTPNLGIDYRTHLILPTHRDLDAIREEDPDSNTIGTTRKGIGPSYQDRKSRIGIRADDLSKLANQRTASEIEKKLERIYVEHERIARSHNKKLKSSLSDLIVNLRECAEDLHSYITDVSVELYNALKAGKRVLFEGAQGNSLDLDFGDYPFVTSSNTIAGAIPSSVGLSLRDLEGMRVIGVSKLYTTRVGEGPFPTEITDEVEAERFRKKADEFGATTGRPRRVGHLDVTLLKEACRLNGVSDLIITKVDILQGEEEIKLGYHSYSNLDGVEYSSVPGFKSIKEEPINPNKPIELNTNLKFILKKISQDTQTPISHISIGPERDQIIQL